MRTPCSPVQTAVAVETPRIRTEHNQQVRVDCQEKNGGVQYPALGLLPPYNMGPTVTCSCKKKTAIKRQYAKPWVPRFRSILRHTSTALPRSNLHRGRLILFKDACDETVRGNTVKRRARRAVQSIVRRETTCQIRYCSKECQSSRIELIRDGIRVRAPRKRCTDAVCRSVDIQGVQFIVRHTVDSPS